MIRCMVYGMVVVHIVATHAHGSAPCLPAQRNCTVEVNDISIYDVEKLAVVILLAT